MFKIAKSTEDHFGNFLNDLFPYGYGDGELHTVPAFLKFVRLCDQGPLGRSYDYRIMEKELGPTVAWLLINLLCGRGLIEYGMSPRFAFLDGPGKVVRAFVIGKTDDEIMAMLDRVTDDNFLACGPETCHCTPGATFCPNPFWNYAVAKEEVASLVSLLTIGGTHHWTREALIQLHNILVRCPCGASLNLAHSDVQMPLTESASITPSEMVGKDISEKAVADVLEFLRKGEFIGDLVKVGGHNYHNFTPNGIKIIDLFRDHDLSMIIEEVEKVQN